MKRVEANDPVALCQEGVLQFSKGDYRRAMEYWTMAAELGDAGAYHHLSIMFHNERVIGQYEGKKIQPAEQAAMGGNPRARFDLGCVDWNHWIISVLRP